MARREGNTVAKWQLAYRTNFDNDDTIHNINRTYPDWRSAHDAIPAIVDLLALDQGTLWIEFKFIRESEG